MSIAEQTFICNDGEIIVDNFAGGGGASEGLEEATGQPVSVAVNHDPDAIAMHKVNHPRTKHLCEDVFHVDPREAVQGRQVSDAWFSPDCKHFSKAKGGLPVEKKIRGLAWVVIRWAATVKPRRIYLENVEEFEGWGPLKDDRPDPERKGETFQLFVARLRRLGYTSIEYRCLRACDYGVPTIRKRLFLVARCDGLPVSWPKPTHGDPNAPGFAESGLLPWRTAAEIIDWSLPCPSIFERKKPLAENTLRRIFKGIQRFVIDNPRPFIVRIGQQGFGGDAMQYPIEQPLTTITTKAEHLVVSPTLVQVGYGERQGQAPRVPGLDKPLGTIVAGGRKHALVAAALVKHYGGNYKGAGAPLTEPAPTVTTTDHNALISANLVCLRNNCDGSDMRHPVPTVTAGGNHIGEVRAFLVKYYSEGGQWQGLDEPVHTILTKARLGLVMVQGEQYQIVDIGMRMLEPHELFAAQGFRPDYIIDRDADGNAIPKYKQVARCGNSVCPGLAAALVRANASVIIENAKTA